MQMAVTTVELTMPLLVAAIKGIIQLRLSRELYTKYWLVVAARGVIAVECR